MKKSPTLLLVLMVVCCFSFGSYTYLETRNDASNQLLQEELLIDSAKLPQAGATVVVGKAFNAIQRLLVK